MTARSTALRYDPDNGPEVFGVPGLAVRWNRQTHTIVLETTDGRWSVSGDFACDLIVALAAVHRQGQLRTWLCQHLRTVHNPWQDRYYRVGKLLCKESCT